MVDRDFVINVGPGGTFRPSGSYQTTPEDIDRMFENFKNRSGDLKISIHFHGGLVNETSGLETARKMASHYSSAGSLPVCFVWETGLIATIRNNIRLIGGTKLVNKLVKMLVKKISKRIGIDLAMGRGPGSEPSDAEIEIELSQPIPFSDYDSKLKNETLQGRGVNLGAKYSSVDELRRDFDEEFKRVIDSDHEFKDTIKKSDLIEQPQQGFNSRGFLSTAAFVKSAVEIAIRVIIRYRDKRHHDFYPTIIEEIFRQFYLAEVGATIWNGMKVKADEMWFKNTSGTTGINQYAGRYFLNKLQALASTRPVTIDVVGHSAGAIVACNLFKHLASDFPTIKIRNVIFLAPACTIALFNNEILNRPQLFSKFRIFTMSDQKECEDILVPYFYTHSLLYLISGILEGGGREFDEYILGMERFTQGSRDPYSAIQIIKATTDYLYENTPDRLILSQTLETSALGLRTQSLKHGAFDDDEQTIESIKHIISR